MQRHSVCLQLRFEAPKDFNLAIASRRAALSGNASLIATIVLFWAHFYFRGFRSLIQCSLPIDISFWGGSKASSLDPSPISLCKAVNKTNELRYYVIIRLRRSRSAAAYSDQTFPWTICRSVRASVRASVCPVHCGKTADRIRMPFGTIARTGTGMRQVVGFGDRSTGRGTFGGEFGARRCNQWELAFAATRPSSHTTLGRLVTQYIITTVDL